MQVMAAPSLATFNGLDSHCPAMPIRRGQNRRFKVGPKIVPQPIGHIAGIVFGISQEVLEAVRLCRIQKTKQTALVLSESSPRNRPEQSGHQGMKWPTPLERIGK